MCLCVVRGYGIRMSCWAPRRERVAVVGDDVVVRPLVLWMAALVPCFAVPTVRAPGGALIAVLDNAVNRNGVVDAPLLAPWRGCYEFKVHTRPRSPHISASQSRRALSFRRVKMVVGR